MTVFFTASYDGKTKYQKYYDLIVKALQKTGIDLISPELGNYQQVLRPSEVKRYKDPQIIHYESIRRGVELADAVVIEVTHSDTQVGYEIALAANSKKYVLCLSLNEDFSEKLHNRYVVGAKYTELSLEETIEDFLVKVDKNTLTERFNCFLSPAQLGHLESRAQVEGVNKSEYLRDLIDRDRKQNQ